MRTAQIKVNNNSITGLLVAGGAGFKIYSSLSVEGWILNIGRKNYIIEETSPAFKTVSNYININYQPAGEAEKIKNSFQILLETKGQSTDLEPSL